MPTSAFAAKLAATAEAEFNAFSNYHETDPKLAARIKTYWEGLGLHFHGTSVAWSAVFVSWNVKKAGATAAEFAFSAQHSVFVHKAIANANAGTGVFRGRRVNQYAPKIGDIIHNNRNENVFDFDYAASHADYKSHTAIVIERGNDAKGAYLLTIGGNEGNSVGRRIIYLDAQGRLRQPAADPTHYICVIENLK